MMSEKQIVTLQDSLVHYPASDPVQFFHQINNLSRSADLLCAIYAASHLGIFDLLAKPKTIDEIAAYFPQKEIIPPLLQFLRSSGFIVESEGKLTRSEAAGEYLSHSSPYTQIPFLEKLIWHLTEHWLSLPEIIRTGPKRYDEQEFFSLRSLPSMASNALTGRLQTVVRTIAALPGFPDSRKMIDLGGGHGLYAMALAQLNPYLQAVVFDQSDVIPLARQYIQHYKMEKQVSLIGGDFFTDDFGDEYDIILSSSNPSGKIPSMIPAIVSALSEKGYFITIQSGDQADQEDYCNQLEWGLWNFKGTQSQKSDLRKKEFFTDEYRHALDSAGLDIVSITSIPDHYRSGYQVTMIITQKRI